MISSICLDFLNENKSSVYSFLIVSSLFYILTIVLVPIFVSKINKIYNTLQLNLFILFVAVTVIFALLIYFFKLKLENTVIPELISHIRSKIVKSYLQKNKVNFEEANITSDINALYEISKKALDFLLWIVTMFLPTLILSFFMNLYFFYISPTLGLLNLACNLFIWKYTELNIQTLFDSYFLSELHKKKMLNKLDNTYHNLFNIYLNNQTDETIEQNNKIEKESVGLVESFNKKVLRFSLLFRIISYLFFGISIAYSYKNSPDMEEFYSTVFILAMYNARIDNIIDRLPDVLTNAFYVRAESQRFLSIPETYERVDKAVGHLVVKDLSFSYPSSTNKIFDQFQLEIHPGERIAITGKTGSGKSTLLKLFLRFYKPHQGTLLLDGKDIQTLDPDDIRKHMYYINQKTMLFHESILNNIRYGTNATEEEVYSLLQNYQLLPIFYKESIPEQDCLSVMIEHNGSNMSMGMQKVIFLTRGILKKAPIYFIDEPFTSIDHHTRLLVQHMIDVETKGKTVIIITHDIEDLNHILDRIIPLHDTVS